MEQNRAYWVAAGNVSTLALADRVLKIACELDPELKPKYNSSSIVLEKNGRSYSFVRIKPLQEYLLLKVKLPDTDEFHQIMEGAELDLWKYGRKHYDIRLRKDDLESKAEAVQKLLRHAYEYRRDHD